MSRAMNISLPEAKVRARCEAAGVAISALEVLPSGGTRLVCMREEGADEMRVVFKSSMIEVGFLALPSSAARTRNTADRTVTALLLQAAS